MAMAAVVFDLDGTILNTLRDIADASNWTLAKNGFPTQAVDAYRYYVGDGVFKLFSRALPAEARDDATIARCAEDFRAAYTQCWNLHTRPYPGIPALLRSLTRRRLGMAVFSNKPEEFTCRCVQEYFGEYPFQAVLGQRPGRALKPDPAGAREILQRLGVPAAQVLYLGDTGVDMATARAAGMFPVGVLWGFRTREELERHGAQAILSTPAELLPLLDDEN